MNALISIIIIAVMATLIFCLYMAVGKIKDLEKAKANLKEQNSKQSDALRTKGIEVEQLKRKIKRLEG